ncbi:MAG: CPBP family intramembrane metalloprotease [Halanaerobiales bacterium]|nr:CPBP family intramembrane metalloprotease [Halanaerobiales bacterium]
MKLSRGIIYSGIFTLLAIVLAFPYIYFMVASGSPSHIVDHNVGVPWGELFSEISKLIMVVFLSCMIGFFWSKKVGFAGLGNLMDLRRNWKQILIYGAFIGFLVYIFGDRYFYKVAPGFYPAQLKVAFFIPFYASLVEEIFARFGTMTLFVKIFKNRHIANILAALIFAVGHVNMFQVAGIIYRLNYVTVCSFILNLCISLFFGYIYWRKGLLTAMGIHFVANLRYIIIAFLI